MKIEKMTIFKIPMGCLKLTYLPAERHGRPETTLRIVESGSSREEKCVQLWLSVDPLVEETMEAYTYVSNNPLRYTDPTGMSADDIIVTSQSSAALEDYKNTVTAAMGGFYTIDIDKNTGEVSLVDTGIGNLGIEMTAEQEGFYNYYSEVIDSDKTIKQEIVVNDNKTVVDNWVTGKIDIGDVKEFDKSNGAASSAGAIIHSTVEQHEKAKMGFSNGDYGNYTRDSKGNIDLIDYKKAHKTAISAENRVNGNYRGVGGNENNFYESNGTTTQQNIQTTITGGINVAKKKIK